MMSVHAAHIIRTGQSDITKITTALRSSNVTVYSLTSNSIRLQWDSAISPVMKSIVRSKS